MRITQRERRNTMSTSIEPVEPVTVTVMDRIREAFSEDDLRDSCERHESDFAEVYGLETVAVLQREPANAYYFKDNGANTLAVAHLDTVVDHIERQCNFVDCEDGTVVFSGALDDRLGANIILDWLPKLGIKHDWLLTLGEEWGASTAYYFEPPKEYLHMIEFDRGGTDVVMYEYEDKETADLVRDAGAKVGVGSFTDICYLDHLEVKGFNWGVGYQEYHGPRGHAFLEDTFSMLRKYLTFYAMVEDEYLPHEKPRHQPFRKSWSKGPKPEKHWWDDDLGIGPDEIPPGEYVEFSGL